MKSMYLKIKREGEKAFRLTVGGWVEIPPGELQPCAPNGGVTVGVVGGAVVATRTDGVHAVYTVALAEEGRLYKLGPKFGYLVKLPEEEHDPVKRVAREIGIPAQKVSPALPEGAAVEVAAGEAVNTDGVRDGNVVRDFTYVIRTFTKEMRKGGRGRFVSGVCRTERLKPESFRRACAGLGLAHRPEWLVSEPPALRREGAAPGQGAPR